MSRSDLHPAPVRRSWEAVCSRRHALSLALASWGAVPSWAAPDAPQPVRLAISESVIGDVNLNDARAAMMVWVQRMTRQLNVIVEPKLFDSTQEIVERTRKGQLDAVALNVVEYRLIADMLDSTQVVTASGEAGMEQYLILARQNSGFRQLGDLKGRHLCALKTPKMCVAPAWLTTILAEYHYGAAEQFFGSVTTDAKYSRVVLPVFFGQADACLTSRRGFDTMCELNPQVARELAVLATSPTVVVNFYMFRKNYQNAQREKLIGALSSLRNSPAGQQLATLFQFDQLAIRDGSCLASALNILEMADRVHSRSAGHKKV